jgi:hypothetical protein
VTTMRTPSTALMSLLCVLAFSGGASAQDLRGQCIAAYESNQQLRKDGKLAAARSELLKCVREGCPDFVRPDCVGWLSEVEQQMPSFVVAAKDVSGSDTVVVSVFVDGKKVADQLDGRPIPIDPGQHELRFVHDDRSVEQSIVIVQGVKSRVIDVSFMAKVAPLEQGAAAVGDPAQDPDGAGDSGQPILAYVLGGLGVAGFVVFAVVGSMGKSEIDELHNRCGDDAPTPEERGTCPAEEVDDAHTKLVVADVAVATGSVLLAAGIGLFIYHHVSDPEPASASAVEWTVGPTIGGASGQVTVSF